MAKNRNLKPKEPGQPDIDNENEVDVSETENTTESEYLDESTEQAKTEFNESDDDDAITMSKSELAAMVASMVEAQVEQRVVSEVKAARRRVELSKTQGATPYRELPDQGDIDASMIKRSVLSKQGWVCPLVHPSDRLRMKNGNSL